MLKAFGLIILGLIVLAVIAAVASKKNKATDAKIGYEYKSKVLLTPNEREMYWKLIDALPGYVVLAQVALSSCINAKKGGAFNTISAKSLDFVICNGSLDVLAGIEIDDKSHATAAAQKRDAAKNSAMEAAGIKLIRWPAVPLPSIEEIRKIFPAVPLAATEKSTLESTQEKKIKILEQQLFSMARKLEKVPRDSNAAGA
jgi:very-short-patch-repair endonuclease